MSISQVPETDLTKEQKEVGESRKTQICSLSYNSKVSLHRNRDADVENGLEDMGRGKGKLGQRERVTLTYIHYQM